MSIAKRIKKIQAGLRRKKIDAILITQPHNRRYLSGYSAPDHDISESSGVLLIPARRSPFLLTDFLFNLQPWISLIVIYPHGTAHDNQSCNGIRCWQPVTCPETGTKQLMSPVD
ncbi:aminopeptidase P family N-terminal domain-containing protein [Desulfotalea psychrophila]|nr:aminopeptidase P family N-terminal domain-containing protein [Desulfotalea psychrophila]